VLYVYLIQGAHKTVVHFACSLATVWFDTAYISMSECLRDFNVAMFIKRL